MNENAKKYLARARVNLLAGDKAGALGSYGVVAIEDPDNGEAAFFSAYMDYVNADGINNIKIAFLKIESSLENAVKSIAQSEGTTEEKLAVIKEIADIYVPMPDFLITSRVINASGIEARVLYLYWFASYIENEFNSVEEAMQIAIIPLKEAVKIQQKFYAYKYEGIKVEDTAARIQKIDPSYIIPKKAGCISPVK